MNLKYKVVIYIINIILSKLNQIMFSFYICIDAFVRFLNVTDTVIIKEEVDVSDDSASTPLIEASQKSSDMSYEKKRKWNTNYC